jgi:hypothetical protein
MRTIKILLLAPLFLYIFSCQREGFITDSSAKLAFSVDTVYFDTVFTQLSTVTRRFTVKNPYKEFIKISTVNLAGGNSSVYRINFDGASGTEFKDIEIAPKDSLYMFVEATLDPNNSSGILLQQDSIVFITNQNVQDVDLVAWGQDVHILRDTIFNSQNWTAEKPYLVLGYAILDSAQVLTIEPGTKIYFHRDSYLLIAGSLLVNGTKENPVRFSGDRLEQLYDDIPGQWTGIILYPWSNNNFINYAEIKGGLVGIVLQSTFDNVSKVDLTILNSRIQHVSSYGIRAAYSKITAVNNIIANCGISAIALEGGGNYEFYHSTIANWFAYNSRNTPSVIFTNFVIFKDQHGKDSLTIVRDLENAYFGNCIIYGSNQTEIAWSEDKTGTGLMNYGFENCLIKFDTTDTPLQGDSHFINCINYKDPLFLNTGPENYDYHFDTVNVSPARDFGKYEIGSAYPFDLDGTPRMIPDGGDGKPDIGAYEFIMPK